MIATKELYEIIQFCEDVQKKIAIEMSVSLPIPILRGDECICRVFYFASSGLPPRQDFDIYPPTWFAEFSWQTGRIIILEEKESDFFGISGNRFRPFAKISYINMDKEAEMRGLGNMKQREEAINPTYDQLVISWFNKQQPDAAIVSKFMALFNSLVEAPFLPIYHRLGRDFFGWLNIVTKATKGTPM